MDRDLTAGENALLGLPFDHYSRYALTRRLVAVIRQATGAKALRILDVGGHSSPLKHFLPDDYVALLDVEPAGSLTAVGLRCDEYVRGSGAALPFADASFGIVTAHDTLEHVPPQHRQSFLEEIVRVAGTFVLLSGPVWNADVARAEARLDAFVKTALLWEQPFLAEHLSLGLPRPEDIEAFLGARRLLYAQVPSGNVTRWLATQGLRHYLAALPDTEALREELDRSYNLLHPDGDHEGVCYSRTYVIAKTPEERAMQRIRDEFPAQAASAAAELDALEGYLAGLETHAGEMRAKSAALHERVFKGEKDSYELRGTLEDVVKRLGDNEAAVRQRDAVIAAREAELLALRAELQAVRESAGYRALERYRSAVRSAFPPDSPRGTPYRAARKAVRSIFGGPKR